MQLFVLFLVCLTPVLARYVNYVSARQLDRVMARFDGSLQGNILELTDGTVRKLAGAEKLRAGRIARDRQKAIAAAESVKGSTWSMEFFGISLTDPLAALESFAASRSIRSVLLWSILLPVLLTVLLGRFFCSYLCPVGFLLEITGKLRRLLRFLEVSPMRLRFSSANKYWVLGIGLAFAVATGLPFLGYLYPPALLGRELHNGVTVLFDRGEEGMLGFTAAGLTVASWFLLAIAAFEIIFGARIWCRSLCPGGAVYSLLGALRIVRVQRDKKACTKCGSCVSICEMGLSPMTDRTGSECDNCGLCVGACSDGALGFHFGMRNGVVADEAAAKREEERCA